MLVASEFEKQEDMSCAEIAYGNYLAMLYVVF